MSNLLSFSPYLQMTVEHVECLFPPVPSPQPWTHSPKFDITRYHPPLFKVVSKGSVPFPSPHAEDILLNAPSFPLSSDRFDGTRLKLNRLSALHDKLGRRFPLPRFRQNWSMTCPPLTFPFSYGLLNYAAGASPQYIFLIIVFF